MNKIEEILFCNVHSIESDLNKVIKKELTEESTTNYIERVIKDNIFIANTRKCTFVDNAALLKDINDAIKISFSTDIDNKKERIEVLTTKIASKFLAVEISAKNKYEENLGIVIKKGSLVQAFIENDEGFSYILAKIEYEDFLDTDKLEKREGLPFKKITLKSSSINFDFDLNLTSVDVSDTGKTISKYWISDFLNMIATQNNADTTKDMYSAISKLLTKTLNENPVEHEFRKQMLNHYFSNESEYNHSKLVSMLTENLNAEELNIKLDDFKIALQTLPTKYKLDSNFVIDKHSLKKKLKTSVTLRPGIEISYEGDPKVLQSRIKAHKDKEQDINILSIYDIPDDVYKRFSSDEE